MKAFLFAPPEYWKLSEEVRKSFRCGPGRGVLEWLVPETMYGLSVSPACSIHDYMYTYGKTSDDKCEADIVFLNNMIRLIESDGGWWLLRKLRLRRAYVYYEAVKDFGGPYYWNEKNKSTEIGLA